MMSGVNQSMLRQTSLLYRVYHLNVTRQIVLPFSTSARSLAEPTSTGTSTNEPPKTHLNEGQSFDSVPVHLGPVSKVIMVLGGLHKRISDVPDTISNRTYQKTKDKFRARCVIASVFGTGLLALVAATRGKMAKKEGKRYTDNIYDMHRGKSRTHDQFESTHKHRDASDRYSPAIDEVNK